MSFYPNPGGAGGYGALDTTTSSQTWLYGSYGSPSVLAVNQGSDIGDCWLLSALITMAQEDPSYIKSMITADGAGYYTVRLFDNGVATNVTISDDLPDGANTSNGNGHWASLIEKACAAVDDSYKSLNGNFADAAYTMLTNQTCYDFDDAPFSQIEAAVSAGKGVELYSDDLFIPQAQPSGSGLSGSFDVIDPSSTDGNVEGLVLQFTSGAHAYAVVGFDAATGNLILRNPWGNAGSATYSRDGVSYPNAYVATTQEDTDDVTATPDSSGYVASGDDVNYFSEFEISPDDLGYFTGGAYTLSQFPTAPTVVSVQSSAPTGDYGVGEQIHFDVVMSEAVGVAGGAPELDLNDGGVANFSSVQNGTTLVFTYVVGSGENANPLAITGVDLNGAVVVDMYGDNADLSGAFANFPGLVIDTVRPNTTVPFDFAGNGHSDILWRNAGGDTYLWNGTGSGAWNYQDLGVVPTNWRISGVGDFDGDGTADILWSNVSGDQYLWYSNGAAGFSFADLGVISTAWTVSGIGDFNGDGKADIIWSNVNGDRYLWEANGSGSFNATDLGIIPTSWAVSGVGDFNGDGKADILWSNANGARALWDANGSGGFDYVNLGTIPTSWTVSGIGDFNGDGKADVLWSDASGDRYLWQSNGSGGFNYMSLGIVSPSWTIQGG